MKDETGRPICEKCGQRIHCGEVVEKQGGPHVLCEDPGMTKHRRLMRPVASTDGFFQIGYVDDNGKEVWL
jgi:hypothetical protein